MKTLLLFVVVLVVVSVVVGQDDSSDKKCPKIPKIWKKKIRLCSKEKPCPKKMICCEYRKRKSVDICVFPSDADKSMTSEWYGEKSELRGKYDDDDDCEEYDDDHDHDSSEEKMDEEEFRKMEHKHDKKDGKRKRCHKKHHKLPLMMTAIGLGLLAVVSVAILVGCCIRRRRMYRGQFQHKRMDIQSNMMNSYKQYPQANMTTPSKDVTKEELKASLGVDFSNPENK